MKQIGNSSTFTAYGVGGCKAGWFHIAFGPAERIRWGIEPTINALVAKAAPDDRIFIDIPIGLPNDRLGRACDAEARNKLQTQRLSSVLSAPVRAVLHHTNNYARANQISRELTGKGLGKPTFNILPKIKEVNDLLGSCGKARQIIREVHPEVCFWALAGNRPMQYKKNLLKGFFERLAVLRELWPSISETIEAIFEDDAVLKTHSRGNLDGDDILNAAAAAITAWAEPQALRTLPEHPLKDQRGLPMEMVYVPCGTARLKH
ncbi:MAG: DUF429 domain-containing protein [Gammaproteobacteria bacterium]|nr:DUF429 domain-containing protein [Gammaproteobacteria bacterium]